MLTPERLTEKLALALGADLRTALIFGSAAVGEDTRRFSNINLLFVTARADAETLAKVAVPVRDWVAGGQPAPLVVSVEEIERSQDVFPIEFSDIRARHRVLHGDAAWIGRLAVDPDMLRHQLEFELRSKLLLLRQAYLSASGDAAAEQDAAARALSSLAALFRATLRLIGAPTPTTTPETIAALHARVDIDGEAWLSLWSVRQGRRAAAENLFPRLIAGLQRLIEFADAHVAS